jgi:hypothetical protein
VRDFPGARADAADMGHRSGLTMSLLAAQHHARSMLSIHP